MKKIDMFNERDQVGLGEVCWWQPDGKGGCYKLTQKEWEEEMLKLNKEVK